MPCVYLPGPAPAVTVANRNEDNSSWIFLKIDIINTTVEFTETENVDVQNF